MKPAAESLPSDLAAAHAMILAERAARLAAETKVAEAANAQAELSNTEALIAHLKLDREAAAHALRIALGTLGAAARPAGAAAGRAQGGCDRG